MNTKPLSERITPGNAASDEINVLEHELADCRQCFDALSARAIAITAERDAFLASLEANGRKIDSLTAQRNALLAACKECLACLCADSDSEEQYASEINQARQAIAIAESEGVL